MKCSSRWIEGSATFTIVASSTIISWPRQSTAERDPAAALALAARRRDGVAGDGAAAVLRRLLLAVGAHVWLLRVWRSENTIAWIIHVTRMIYKN